MTERSQEALAVLVAEGLITDEQARNALSRLTAGADLENGCPGASLVVESIVEDRDAKVALLVRIAELAPSAILATNTSSLSISDLGRRSGTARRLVGTHYWNPPTLMPLVEVIPGHETDADVVSTVLATLIFAGKEPVVAPDIPGFIWNRLQMAVLREAVALTQRHGVPPATVDLVMRRGLGRRAAAQAKPPTSTSPRWPTTPPPARRAGSAGTTARPTTTTSGGRWPSPRTAAR